MQDSRLQEKIELITIERARDVLKILLTIDAVPEGQMEAAIDLSGWINKRGLK